MEAQNDPKPKVKYVMTLERKVKLMVYLAKPRLAPKGEVNQAEAPVAKPLRRVGAVIRLIARRVPRLTTAVLPVWDVPLKLTIFCAVYYKTNLTCH